jgi:hypothetical protein
MSEEFSSRVAESTRLILVKDGFGGDERSIGVRMNTGRTQGILEWFRPPERNTLRPLGSCIDCVTLGPNLAWAYARVSEPPFQRVHFPFYSTRGALTLCGAPTGGPSQQEPVL